MGIKHFWIWFKENFGNDIKTYNDIYKIDTFGIDVDMLAIDMNGIFHTCAQKVYKYGNYAPHFKKLLRRNNRSKERRLFQCIGETIDFYRRLVNPKKRLLLCVDGIAGMAKMAQQRQRRFRSARDGGEMAFDPNCITPGTRFMDNLTKYIDWYIRCQMSVSPEWQNLEVIFSNEKVVGEGEHKIINYLRKYQRKGESCCIHGMDADLIMLGMASPCEKMYILRDDSFNLTTSHVVNLTKIKEELIKRLVSSNQPFGHGNQKHIYDFVLMCYSVGNDFLPHAPGIEILSGGIDSMIEIYQEVEEEFGYLSRNFKGKKRLCAKSLSEFLSEFSTLEEQMFNDKLNNSRGAFPDKLVEKHTITGADGKKRINIENYKRDYYAEKFPGIPVKTVCEEYIFGVQWVLDYYTSGIPSWQWNYPWHYSPFLSDVAEVMKTYKNRKYADDQPFTPFQQLMTVLPEKSSKLLPKPIANLMKESSPTLGQYFPAEFEIDLAGKRREWEGIVLLPAVDTSLFISELEKVLPNVDPRDLRRNKFGKIFGYKHVDISLPMFRSYYGNITQNNCRRYFLDF